MPRCTIMMIALFLSFTISACGNGTTTGYAGDDDTAPVYDGDIATDGDLLDGDSSDGDTSRDGDSEADLDDDVIVHDGDQPDGDDISDGDGIDAEKVNDGDEAADGDVDEDIDPDLEAPPPVDCSPIAGHADWELCTSSSNTCEAVFNDHAGCITVCAEAGLVCSHVYENVDDMCAADFERPELTCDPPSNHQSDYCICVREDCEPDCDGRQCGDNGCGGVCGECDEYANSFCDENGFSCACSPNTCGVPQVFCGSGLDNGCGGVLNCPADCPNSESCVNSRCTGPRCELDNCPAFPGAEGEGMYTFGGRGGDVCHVTNTSDSGVGSLRDCVAGSGARTVVFDTGGIITLNSPLRIDRSNLTLAGQTAPGDGVTIRGYQVDIRGSQTIVRHLRFRAGDIKKKSCPSGSSGFTEDSVTIQASNVIFDHVSASWGIDENLSASANTHNLTVQYSIIAEGLYQTGLYHGDCNSDYNPGGSKGHSMGSLFKPGDGGDLNISIHHNLYAHSNNRNPAVGTYETDQDFDADIRNNLIYNCPSMGYTSGASGRGRVNYIGNFAVWGPSTDDDTLFDPNQDNDVDLYQSDNRIDKIRNRTISGFDWGWSMFGGDYSRASSAFSMRTVTTHASTEVIEIVLANAGARPWNRDSADSRIVASVRTNTGSLINSQSEVGGWGAVAAGTPPVDSDRDGMPNDWELNYGTNPDIADNNGDLDSDGYTNLEEYLHWAARWPR